jgi:Zn-finger nucleic acid-binding protein
MSTAPTALSCPICKVPFVQGGSASKRIHACATCGGVWLDNEVSTKIVQTFDEESVDAAADVAKHATKPVQQHSTLDCPECGEVMRVVRVDLADVDLDVCATHGTWFDSNELEKVARAFQAQREAKAGGRTSKPPAEPSGASDPASSAIDTTMQMLQEFEEFM